MKQKKPEWQALSAYVDGELDATEGAAVAEIAGNHRAVAEQISVLYQLKGATHAALAAPAGDLTDLLPKAPRRSRMMRTLQLAAALLVVAVLTAGWFWFRPAEGALPPELLATARMLHTEWLHAQETGADEGKPATLVAALARFRHLPVVPDLESGKLFVDRVSFADHTSFAGNKGGHVLQVGYRGLHGCHLSLFVFSDVKLPGALTRLDAGKDRFYGWQVHDLGYLLFAEGMDGNRFDLIARKVEEETRSRAPFDGTTRQALAESKRRSKSCAA
jgi:hypothetical protein